MNVTLDELLTDPSEVTAVIERPYFGKHYAPATVDSYLREDDGYQPRHEAATP